MSSCQACSGDYYCDCGDEYPDYTDRGAGADLDIAVADESDGGDENVFDGAGDPVDRGSIRLDRGCSFDVGCLAGYALLIIPTVG